MLILKPHELNGLNLLNLLRFSTKKNTQLQVTLHAFIVILNQQIQRFRLGKWKSQSIDPFKIKSFD